MNELTGMLQGEVHDIVQTNDQFLKHLRPATTTYKHDLILGFEEIC